jgi:hypothetical protein
MRIRIKTSLITSKFIDGALYPSWSTVKDMGADHRRFGIIVAKKFLNCVLPKT